MSIPRSFMRLCKLSPSCFRVLCNGMSHPTSWSTKLCMRETKLSPATVYRAMSYLMDHGYVIKQPHPLKRSQFGYRFYWYPVAMKDEDKPWYKEMMLQNKGKVDGLVFGPSDVNKK